eukprot:CAMPEP_0185576434 /NCGR_PEP_ID=MMETSP0434-20130131/7363_1 /TAXON_ID=626734 ORGANISM="Favella taraikaensis, Strain Fe Narragansett Bay" /NCGR_SAMPLE_ID=MMETSP0434 /ASSEMBLY_ACC=CAM_ASM_000379 /LENGTH=140 /DNA_ID=CAMNT_0028193641 /DNA_START=1310 /DNA_END=1729 /DNA_ORIENTATION=+
MTFDEEAVVDPTMMLKNTGLRRLSRILPSKMSKAIKSAEALMKKEGDDSLTTNDSKVQKAMIVGQGIASNFDNFGQALAKQLSESGILNRFQESIPEVDYSESNQSIYSKSKSKFTDVDDDDSPGSTGNDLETSQSMKHV